MTKKLGNYLNKIVGGGTPSRNNNSYWSNDIPWASVKDISGNSRLSNTQEYISNEGLNNSASNLIPSGKVIVATRMAVGKAVVFDKAVSINQDLKALYPNNNLIDEYLFYLMTFHQKKLELLGTGSTVKGIRLSTIKNLEVFVPHIREQKKIAQILSTWDEAIEAVEELIEKKKKLKKGLFQKYLPLNELSYKNKSWKKIKLKNIVNILDSKRVPLNSEQRNEMNGDIPYYGANGVVDYVNDFLFDEKLILLAEDGGHFYGFQERPIAYIVDGKSWVNNHAHVLSVKEDFDFNFCFYSLQHRDITKYLNGGTRAKLNRGELEKIPLFIPKFEIQKELGLFFTRVDKELSLLKAKKKLLDKQKKGFMQRLLTGKVRVN